MKEIIELRKTKPKENEAEIISAVDVTGMKSLDKDTALVELIKEQPEDTKLVRHI